jgi:hypothetical protein
MTHEQALIAGKREGWVDAYKFLNDRGYFSSALKIDEVARKAAERYPWPKKQRRNTYVASNGTRYAYDPKARRWMVVDEQGAFCTWAVRNLDGFTADDLETLARLLREPMVDVEDAPELPWVP